MRSVTSFAIGLAVAFGWLVVWNLVLRAFDLSFFVPAERRALRRERLVRLGKLRYILIFGVLGFGVAMGLVQATVGLLAHDSGGWLGGVGKLVVWAVLWGGWMGAWSWNESFRVAVPFPPPFPPKR